MNEDIEKESAVKLLEETDKNISEVREKIASVKLSIKNCKLTDYERNEFIQNQEVALNNLNRVFSGLSSKQNTLLMRIRSEVRSGEKAQKKAEKMELHFKLNQEAQERKRALALEKIKLNEENNKQISKTLKKANIYHGALTKIKTGINNDSLDMAAILEIVEFALKYN